MYQDYVEILEVPCKWKPTPELRWRGIGDEKVLQQLWRADYRERILPFLGPLSPRFDNIYRIEWRDVPE